MIKATEGQVYVQGVGRAQRKPSAPICQKTTTPQGGGECPRCGFYWDADEKFDPVCRTESELLAENLRVLMESLDETE
jgi:hypothetical protein